MVMKSFIVSVFLLLQMIPSFAQESSIDLAKIQERFVSPWLFTIEGDPRQLMITIKAITPKQGGFNLDITYGELNGSQGPFKADLTFEGENARFIFVTQSKNKLDVLQTSENSFQGSFAGKIAKLNKVAQETLQAKLNVNTPEACSAFSGGWTGGWQDFDTQRSIKLWVQNIGPNCSAKISFRTSNSDDKPPTSDFWDKRIEVKDGAALLSVPCSNTGPCDLKVEGGVVTGSYFANGFRNRLVLKKIN